MHSFIRVLRRRVGLRVGEGQGLRKHDWVEGYLWQTRYRLYVVRCLSALQTESTEDLLLAGKHLNQTVQTRGT